MDFETFCEALTNELRGYYEEGTEIHVNKVLKNNDICLQSLVILEKGEKMAPNIYLDEFYLKFNMGSTTIHEIANEIVQQRKAIIKEPMVEMGCTWDEVKDKLFCRVINKERNKEKLSNMPHMEYLDLAVTVRILNLKDENGIASAEVDDTILNKLGVSEKELFTQAMQNTEVLFPVKTQSLVDVIVEKMNAPMELKEMLTQANPYPMQVISNETGLNGATVMLYTDALSNLAEELKVDYFYIMPSSVHECVVITDNDNIEDMKELVEEANRNVVTQMDYLSGSVYRYDVESNIVKIVA